MTYSFEQRQEKKTRECLKPFSHVEMFRATVSWSLGLILEWKQQRWLVWPIRACGGLLCPASPGLAEFWTMWYKQTPYRKWEIEKQQITHSSFAGAFWPPSKEPPPPLYNSLPCSAAPPSSHSSRNISLDGQMDTPITDENILSNRTNSKVRDCWRSDRSRSHTGGESPEKYNNWHRPQGNLEDSKS